MTKRTRLGLSLVLITGLGASIAGLVPANASPNQDRGAAAAAKLPSEPAVADPSDSLPNPIADKQAELRRNAVAAVLQGEKQAVTVDGKPVVRMGSKPSASGDGVVPQYVPLTTETTDQVFTLLVEFGNKRHPDFPDEDVDPATPGPSRYDGPLFNQIPKPPANDNSTGWQANYSKAYYRELYFGTGEGVESLKSFYETQSSGRYSIKGSVTDFIKVKYNEARYGRPFEGVLDGVGCTLDDIVCSNTWALIGDAMKKWFSQQRAAGQTGAQIAATLARYDKLDRYDFDGDGVFEEPDGYIDRFQIVHSGGDQADGDPYQGEDAIWSHRWYSHYTDEGVTGPAGNKLGGTRIGTSDFWVGDYTINPENGGLSTIAHEYGHDLGLPDHYDTVASGDNPVSWYNLMAQSRLSAPGDQGIGTRPGNLGVWDKLQLGWLDYELVVAGQDKTIDLGPHAYNTDRAQGVVVVLPDKVTTTTLATPAAGAKQWWSGQGNNYSAVMSRADIAVPAGGGQLSMKLAYNIEEDFDYAFVEVQSPAGGGAWTALPTSSVDPDAGSDADEAGIDGASAAYQTFTADLAAYAGTTIGMRVRYVTDGAAQGNDPSIPWTGVLVDDIKVTNGGTTVFSDGAETSPNGWTLTGFASVGGSFTTTSDQFYLASHRAYLSYDKYLQTGPYNFGFPAQPDLVEHFPYQDGLLVNYWDASYSDNNTSAHPGGGLILPFDAHPAPLYNVEGAPWRGRIQNYDGAFGLQTSDSFTLHVNGKPSYIRGTAANPVFDDSNPNRYYTPLAQAGLNRVGVKSAGVGVRIEVLSQEDATMTIRVYPAD